MTKHKLSIVISGLALLAVVISATTSEVHAAEVTLDSVEEQSSALVAYPTLPLLMVVLQQQYVLDPPMQQEWIFVASVPETQESALLTQQSLHLLD